MEEERKNGITNNAVVVRRKQGIKKRGLHALWAAILLQFKIRVPKRATIAASNDTKEDLTESTGKNETTWKDIMGGIRPLHLHPLEYPSSVSLPPPPPPPFDTEIYHDVLPPSSPKSMCDGMSSRYCSAEDLLALDKSNDDTEGAVDEGGSNVINTQAEEFIAKFYEQIRLQRIQSLNESYPQTENGD
jgi:Cotton fibre expressed protein